MNDTPFVSQSTASSQVDLYKDLQRIGELEDQKKEIQAEIDERTERLRVGIKTIDSDSLLSKMLTSVLKPAPAKKKTVRKTSKKK